MSFFKRRYATANEEKVIEVKILDTQFISNYEEEFVQLFYFFDQPKRYWNNVQKN